jgi:two-component system chemotaxis response regulator CheY
MAERTYRVMVIDDASLVRLYYRQALEESGYQVDEALNGLEALERLMTRPVDMLIVDVNMPRMDGMTFLETLRRQPHPLGSIPALVTSTEGERRDVENARAAGANFYHVKPLSQSAIKRYAAIFCGRLA